MLGTSFSHFENKRPITNKTASFPNQVQRNHTKFHSQLISRQISTLNCSLKKLDFHRLKLARDKNKRVEKFQNSFLLTLKALLEKTQKKSEIYNFNF